MPLTAFQFVSQIAFSLACAVLSALLVYKGSCRRWPFLFAWATFEAVLTAYLLTLNTIDHYAAYFYVYWSGEIVQGLLVLGLTFDIVRRIPNAKYAPSHLVAGFVTLAITLAGACAWLAHGGGTHTFEITMMVFSFSRCVSVTWGAFAASLFFAVGFCGLGWTATLIRLASGLLIFIAISGGKAYAMSAWPHYTYRIDDYTKLCIIGVWIFWAVIISLEKESEEVFHSDRALSFIKAILPNK